jgi:hypothetical protein
MCVQEGILLCFLPSKLVHGDDCSPGQFLLNIVAAVQWLCLSLRFALIVLQDLHLIPPCSRRVDPNTNHQESRVAQIAAQSAGATRMHDAAPAGG